MQNGENKNKGQSLLKTLKIQVQHFGNFCVGKILSLELIKCKYREKIYQNIKPERIQNVLGGVN